MVLSFCPTCHHSKTLYELPSYLGSQVPNLKDTGDTEFKLSLEDVWMTTTDSNQNNVITHISPTPSNLKK